MAPKSCAVIGAGLVGAATALALQRQGYDVTLVDARAPEISCGQLGLDIRNVALNPQSQSLLADLGVWEADRVAAYDRMRIWEQTGTSELSFAAADAGRQEIGWIAENSPLQVALYQQATAMLEVLEDELVNLDLTDTQAELKLSSGAQLAVDFVVGADGANSVVRELLQIGVKKRALGQYALATVVQVSEGHQNCAWQRFLSDGPLAMLPALDDAAGNHRVSVVWSQSQATVQALKELSDEQFCSRLSAASEHCLGEVIAVDQRLSFPLAQQQAEQLHVGAKVVLLGDAARVVHPLAGLGVNLGFEDTLALLRVTETGQALTNSRRLAEFCRARESRSQHMIMLLDTLRILYRDTRPARHAHQTRPTPCPELRRSPLRGSHR